MNCNPKKSFPCGASCQTNSLEGNCSLKFPEGVSSSLRELKTYISKNPEEIGDTPTLISKFTKTESILKSEQNRE